MADTIDNNSSASDKEASLHDVFSKSQSQFFQQWAKVAATFQEAISGVDTSQSAPERTRQVVDLYASWKENAGKYLDAVRGASGANTGTDTFSKVLGAGDAYMKLYEFWEPLTRALQQRALDPDSYQSLVDPAKYAEMVDEVFGFGTPKAMAGLAKDASHLVETWAAKAQVFVEPWSEAMRASTEESLKLASGDPDASLTIFRSFHSAFQDTFGKALSMPAVGKDREYVELLSNTVDRYADFLAKNAELQRHMQAIARHAMDQVVTTMAQRVEAGESISGFGEFVKLWTAANEKAFLEFFETEQFSQLQGIVLDTAVDSRKHFQQLMEVCLKDYPIALRSDMDDVCRTTYTLNKSVRALRRKSSEVDALRQEMKDLKETVAAMEKKLSEIESSRAVESGAKKGSSNKAGGKKKGTEVR